MPEAPTDPALVLLVDADPAGSEENPSSLLVTSVLQTLLSQDPASAGVAASGSADVDAPGVCDAGVGLELQASIGSPPLLRRLALLLLETQQLLIPLPYLRGSAASLSLLTNSSSRGANMN